MVPDKHDIRGAVTHVRQSFAVRPAGHVIHAVADLISQSQRWTARGKCNVNYISLYMQRRLACIEEPASFQMHTHTWAVNYHECDRQKTPSEF